MDQSSLPMVPGIEVFPKVLQNVFLTGVMRFLSLFVGFNYNRPREYIASINPGGNFLRAAIYRPQ